MSKRSETDLIAQRLDRVIEILEDLFISQGSVARMKRQELRGVVGLGMKRINRISKHIKLPLDEHELMREHTKTKRAM